MKLSEATREAIAIHQAAGRRFQAGGVGSFVREQGRGGTVVHVHGVPTSSFLYRKMVPAVAGQGLHAVAFDFPGLGLADRPDDFDYSWTGLANWMGEAIDALDIDRCHLVVHDIGGPIGFEWAVKNPDRVLSMTALNTFLDVATFQRPWPMRPFAIRGIGEVVAGDAAAVARQPAVLPRGNREPLRHAAARGGGSHPPAEAQRPWPCVPAHHARLRADAGEAALPVGRAGRPHMAGAHRLGRA